MRGVKAVIESYGLFCSLYVDCGSHYWNTPKVGGKVDKNNPTQFGLAMQQLGIELIAAYSPEERRCSARMFRTLQDRLPKELALAGITTMDAANQFLKDTFLRQFNQRFTVKPQEELSAFVPWLHANMTIDDILCIQEKRTVNKDNTVSYRNKRLQIPKDKQRCHYVKAQVRIHAHADGTLAIFHGPRCLAYYHADGRLKNHTPVSQTPQGAIAHA